MKNRLTLYNLISKFFFNFIISISFISFNKCNIIKVLQAFKQYGTYVTDCEDEELFENKTCVPISTEETDINNMFDKIASYYQNISIVSQIIIEGEGINYTITTNNIEKDNNGLLHLGDSCTNILHDIDDYYIVLINIKSTNYMTTSNGIRIFKSSEDKHFLSEFCDKTTINIGIPIEISLEDKTSYKDIKNEYGYNIFNSDDPFYNDKCTKFTTQFDSDITLKKRNELYLIYTKIYCSDKCLYDKFDENKDILYCNCNFAGESKKENEIETERFNIKVVKCINKSFSDFKKNYIFFAICILSFSFIICFFITCISLSNTISEYSKEFSELKKKFSKYYFDTITKEAKNKEPKGGAKLEQIEKAKNKKNLNEIEEENNDNIDDENEEQEEESDEVIKKKFKKNSNKNNLNNINQMNNPFFNSFPNNSMPPYNVYNPFFQYQWYQQYMMNYMNSLYLNNNTINNNENYDEDEDEEDNKRNGNRKKKSCFTIKLDYNKLKEYALKMKKQKEINLKNIKKRAKKMKYLNDEFDKNFNIDIFKKKKESKSIKNNKEKIFKFENKKGNEKEKNLKNVNGKKKFNIENKDKKSADYKNNRNIIRKQIYSKSLKLDNKLNSKLKEENNKPNPPKNSIGSERELLSSGVKPNDESKVISHLNNDDNEREVEENEEEKEEDNNEEKEEDEENCSEKKEESNEEEMSSAQKKEDSQQEEENEDNNTENKENIEKESDNNDENRRKNNTGEKEKKLLKLNLNSNGDNSTISNIINNSKNSKNTNIENKSNNKKRSISNKKDNNEKIEIKFDSEEFYKMLNKIPEEKKMEFFKESELNHLDYKYACDIDGRMFFQIYSAMLKEQNNLILSLSLCGNDYYLSSLKFSFLCVQIILYLTVSAIFFNDDIIDNIFLNENKFKISYMIKPMAFTYLICLVITTLLKALIKINNNVVDIKNEAQTYEEGINAIRLKLIFYFIIGFIINIIGFCLLTSFCSIFINTKMKLIKCAIFAFLFNFIVSVIFCFIITSFRTCSMNKDRGKTSCLYTTSNILTYL